MMFRYVSGLGQRIWIALVVCLFWGSFILSSPAQVNDIRLESRVDRLESELSRVRSQLTRLEAQVSGPSRAAPTVAPNSDVINELSLEEQFDNLATLAIELKQNLRQLEARVAEVEQAVFNP